MSENLSEAFIILAVGMITVFVILALVVLTGKILIRITNKFAPPTPIRENSSSAQFVSPIPNSENFATPNNLNKKKIAAVIGTVEHITQGKGKIKNIQKL